MDEKVINFALFFSLISVIILSISLVLYVAFHDYLFITIYNLALGLVSKGTISSEYITENIIIVLEQIPVVVDIAWFIVFLFTCGTLIVGSYYSRRMGYGEVFSWLTFGMLVVLFISSLIYQLTQWIKGFMIDGLLVNLAPELIFFTYYLTNFGTINALIIVACIISSFIDLDYFSFNNRKNKEKLGDEVV